MKPKPNTRVACNPCRQRKLGCDGGRPTCSSCQKRNVTCAYDTDTRDESRYAALKREVEELRSMLAVSEQSMTQLRGQMQQLEDHAALYDEAVAPEVLSILPFDRIAGLSEHAARRATLPPTYCRLEYQLIVSHPVLYPCFAPPNGRKLSLEPLLRRATRLPATPVPEEHSGSAPHPRAPSSTPTPSKWAHTPPCDPRLSDLDISFWTDVPITSDEAISIISMYLTSDQPILGLLDTDLFIEDLLAQRSRYCSRFLVSCLLYWGSHAYKVKDESTPVAAFREEAQSIWKTQALAYDAATIVGALLISLAASSDGLSDVSDQYMDSVFNMANTLGWFGSVSDIPTDLDEDTAKLLRAESHAAWGIFNYITMISFQTQRRIMTAPPKFPIPGDGGVIGFMRGSNIAVYHQLPDYMGQTFTHACQFFLIANEITLRYLAEDEDTSYQSISLDFAESIYQRLLHWSDEALVQLTGTATDTEHQTIFHMWIHCRILELFRPFLASPLKLQTFGEKKSTTRDIYTASLNQLKRHMLVFPLRFSSATYSGWFSIALLQTISSVIGDPLAPDCRYWFGVGTRAFLALSVAWPIVGEILRVFVGMAVGKGIVSAQEAQGVLQSSWSSIARQAIKADYVLDMDLAMTNRKEARMDRLAFALESQLDIGDGQLDSYG